MGFAERPCQTSKQIPTATLPAPPLCPHPFYFNPATFEEEKTKIFASTWQVSRSYSPGREFPATTSPFDLIGEPLLIARGDDGILRCFYNVCRHRAGNPASGCGNRKLFRCGYHGWTYRLDGALLVTPEFDGVEDFDPADFGLAPFGSRNGSTLSSSISIPRPARCPNLWENCQSKLKSSISTP